jgi:hypothetical protein
VQQRFKCRHAHNLVLKDLPQHFQSFTLSSAASTEEDMIPAPDMGRTVMMRPAYDSARIAITAESTEYAPPVALPRLLVSLAVGDAGAHQAVAARCITCLACEVWSAPSAVTTSCAWPHEGLAACCLFALIPNKKTALHKCCRRSQMCIMRFKLEPSSRITVAPFMSSPQQSLACQVCVLGATGRRRRLLWSQESSRGQGLGWPRSCFWSFAENRTVLGVRPLSICTAHTPWAGWGSYRRCSLCSSKRWNGWASNQAIVMQGPNDGLSRGHCCHTIQPDQGAAVARRSAADMRSCFQAKRCQLACEADSRDLLQHNQMERPL